MPLIDITYPEGALTAEQRQSLADELTTALLRAERAPDTEFFRSITWAYVHELPEGTVLSAGRPVSEPTFRVDVTTPEGALSDRRRAELVAEATRVVREIAGIDEGDSLRIWVLCHEVAQQLVAAAKQQREQAEEPVATT
jgi:phenylpyruvate tautomerase PptA (4-oxalocrotonate tautomerase family)